MKQSEIHEMDMNCSGVTDIPSDCSNVSDFNLTDVLQTTGNNFSVTNISLAILVGVIGIVTIFGNLLVIISFIIERRLIQPFNLFILNLAVTDFVVGITVAALFCYDTLLGYWPFGKYMCAIWIYFDYVLTFASVFTLVAISVDRLWCVTWPIHFRMHNNKRKSSLVIAIIWFSAIAIWTPAFIADRLNNNDSKTCRYKPSKNSRFVLYVAVAGHYVPCTIMIFCYIKVLLVMRRQRQPAKCATTEVTVSPVKASHSSDNPDGDHVEYRNRNKAMCKPSLKYDIKNPTLSECQQSQAGATIASDKVECKKDKKQQFTQKNETFFMSQRSAHQIQREKRMFMSLTYILFTFMACWFPYYISFHLSALEPDLMPAGVFSVFGWLTYVNSTLNPFIYAYTNIEFRQAFINIQKLICRSC